MIGAFIFRDYLLSYLDTPCPNFLDLIILKIMRNIDLVTGEYYHIFNHGIDTRNITTDHYDSNRFVQCLKEFNTIQTTGGIYQNSFIKKSSNENTVDDIEPLVDILAYCFNPNHFHLLLRQNIDDGIWKLMHRLTMGYSKYFNAKQKRKGSLFRGPFRAVHIVDDAQLLYTMAYVAYNDKIHKLGHGVSKLARSNAEYLEKLPNDPHLRIIFDQFKDEKDYKKYIEEVIEISQRAKIEQSELDDE